MLNFSFTNESRLDLINLSIDKTNAKKYLEIGCFKDKIFNNAKCSYKIGVDPVQGGNRRMTSDEFFLQNTDTFDVIFIDGLHYYEQVLKDFENSLNCLNDNGIIIIHDMLPRIQDEAVVPIPDPFPKTWLGDVWRLSFDLASREDILFKLVLIDEGCGFIKKESQVPKKFNVENSWTFYEKNVYDLPLITYQDLIKEVF
jgi:SAM-dependent methyltransferase